MRKALHWLNGYWAWAKRNPVTFLIELIFTGMIGMILGFAGRMIAMGLGK